MRTLYVREKKQVYILYVVSEPLFT